MDDSPTARTDLTVETLSLIRNQRTMVLATCRDNAPWAAPVYYLFHKGGFYFFSSPRAVHIEQSLEPGKSAAAIFADNDNWKHISGLQMKGRIEPVQSATRKVSLTTRYILKFPFSKNFLHSGGAQAVPHLEGRVLLYGFMPDSAFVVDNRRSFGRRLAVDPATFNLLEPHHDP